MTDTEYTGYHYIYSDLVLTTKDLRNKKPLLSYHNEMYEGWSFMKDKSRTVRIEVGKKLSIEILNEILKKNTFPQNIRATLKEMVKRDKVDSCSFIEQSFDVKSIRWETE